MDLKDVILLSIPAFKQVKAANLPEKANRPGTAYFVRNDDGTPLGIAVSEADRTLKFYSVMQQDLASSVFLEHIEGLSAETVQEAIRELATRKSFELAHETGDSDEAVMSQKAVTDSLTELRDTLGDVGALLDEINGVVV